MSSNSGGKVHSSVTIPHVLQLPATGLESPAENAAPTDKETPSSSISGIVGSNTQFTSESRLAKSIITAPLDPAPLHYLRTRTHHSGFQPSSIKLKHKITEASVFKQQNIQWRPHSRSGGTIPLIGSEYRPAFPKYCFSASTYQSILTDSSQFCEDITLLPKPKHTLMTHELPFVYRYKIQQGLTSLAKMAPRRQAQRPDHIW